MKIAFVLPNYSGHVVGSVLVYYMFASHLARQGHQVDVYHPALDREHATGSRLPRACAWAVAKSLSKHPVAWHEFPSGAVPRFRPTFKGMTLRHDVVVAFSWRGLEWLRDIRTRGRAYGYVVEYETWAEARGERKERMERAYACGLPLLCSSVVVKEMLEGLGLPDVRPCVHGIDRSIYAMSVPVDERPPMRVGCPVRSEAVKSPEVLKAVLESLRNRHGKAISLWGFGGNSPPEGVVGLLDDYHVHPSHQRLAELHNGSSVFFVPSRKEGFGMPAAEAMSCGCALASVDNGGVRTFATDGLDALLVPPESPDELSMSVTRLIEDPGLRSRIALAGVESTAFLDWNLAGARFAREIGA